MLLLFLRGPQYTLVGCKFVVGLMRVAGALCGSVALDNCPERQMSAQDGHTQDRSSDALHKSDNCLCDVA